MVQPQDAGGTPGGVDFAFIVQTPDASVRVCYIWAGKFMNKLLAITVSLFKVQKLNMLAHEQWS